MVTQKSETFKKTWKLINFFNKLLGFQSSTDFLRNFKEELNNKLKLDLEFFTVTSFNCSHAISENFTMSLKKCALQCHRWSSNSKNSYPYPHLQNQIVIVIFEKSCKKSLNQF